MGSLSTVCVAFRRAAVLGLASLALSACSPSGAGDRDGGDAAVGVAIADAELLPPNQRGGFSDLPGVAAFAELSPEHQRAVIDRANRTRCDCGCEGHSVNHCLHQRETCEVAVRLANVFVQDAKVLALQPSLAVGGARAADVPSQAERDDSEQVPAGEEAPADPPVGDAQADSTEEESEP